MKKQFILSLIITLFLIPTAQAVTKSPIKQMFQPAPDKAVVYLLRPSRLVGAIRTAFIYGDQTFLGALDNNTYTVTYVEPGTHLIWTNWISMQKSIEFVAGQTYYLDVWTQVAVLSATQGEGMIASIPNFATATEKETQVAQKHIKNRYGRAVKKMEKDDYAVIAPTQNPVPSVQKSGSVLVAAGTPIQVKLMENITSGYSQVGDEIMVQVVAPLVLGGKTLVSAGTMTKGIVNHKSKGQAGGVGGDLDVVIPSVPAVDGSLLPVAGLLSRTSEDRSNDALARQMVFGLAGFFSVGSRQTYLFSQEAFTIPVKQDSWVVLQSGNARTVTATNPVAPLVSGYDGIVEKTIKFQPQKKTKMADVRVILPAQYQWDNLSLVAIGGMPLPKPIPAKEKVAGKTEQTFIFDSWSVVRYLPLGLSQKEYSLQFAGRSGGNEFPVMAKVAVEVKVK